MQNGIQGSGFRVQGSAQTQRITGPRTCKRITGLADAFCQAESLTYGRRALALGWNWKQTRKRRLFTSTLAGLFLPRLPRSDVCVLINCQRSHGSRIPPRAQNFRHDRGVPSGSCGHETEGFAHGISERRLSSELEGIRSYVH